MKNRVTQAGRIAPVVALLLMWLGCGDALSAEALPANPEQSQTAPAEKSIETKLNEIKSDLRKRQQELNTKTKQLRSAKDSQTKKGLEMEIASLTRLIEEQQKSFEMIVTGGLEQSLIEEKQEVKFDWQKDLLDILQPIMSELRQLTENKRKQQNLKNRILFHQSQIDTVNEAINRIKTIDHKGLEQPALAEFKRIKTAWQKKVEEHQHLMEVAQLQMDEMLKPEEEQQQSFQTILENFFVGRGATLFLALAAALLVFGVMRALQGLVVMIRGTKTRRKSRTVVRFMGILYQIATIILSIIAIFAVFHERGDRVLQAIAILILLAILLVLKNSIPQFIGELRLLLNIGLVREGERILYNGLPWLVESLNVYSSLVNPAIVGGKIRVPIQVLTNLHSRKSLKEEPWFPCRMEDYVFLDDLVYGQVKVITVEGVVLQLAGGAQKSYGISNFLGNNPLNLSTGFCITTLFGIDYQYQDRATTEIPRLFKEGVLEGLEKRGFGEHLTDVKCEFEEAAASSLNYKIMVNYSGEAANAYNPIKRALQQLAVDVCNQHKLEVPFNQLTIHHTPS
ncbi:MAG: hypothetical protein HQL72_03120 [Magnetococcales bacterium]|nr:hypothetical protein [Magnetococcales bacterium]